MRCFYLFPENSSYTPGLPGPSDAPQVFSVCLPHTTHTQIKKQVWRHQSHLTKNAERSESAALSFTGNLWRQSTWTGHQTKIPNHIQTSLPQSCRLLGWLLEAQILFYKGTDFLIFCFTLSKYCWLESQLMGCKTVSPITGTYKWLLLSWS